MDVCKVHCDVRNEFLNMILEYELINKEFICRKDNLTSTECQVFGWLFAAFLPTYSLRTSSSPTPTPQK
jgi:hypothetical protein